MTPRQRWALSAVITASTMAFLDTTLVSVALARIGRELETSIFGILEAQSYVYNGYLLTLSALLIPAGAASDRFGRKRVLVVGITAFSVTSLLCGLSPNMEFLIGARLLQGAAGALLVPGALSIITATFSRDQRGRAFGLWTASSSAGLIVGPVVMGFLIDSISWRTAFFINVPLGVFALAATLRHVDESVDPHVHQSIDWAGAAVAILAVGGLSFGTIRGQEAAWDSPSAFVALLVGAAATFAFPVLLVRRKPALIDPHLFRNRNFTITNISTVLIYASIYVVSYLTLLFLVGTLGYNEPGAGLGGVVTGVLLASLSTRFGSLATKHGPRVFMATGPLVMALGVALLTRVPADSSPWILDASEPGTWAPSTGYLFDFLPAWFFFGLGLAILVAPLTTCLMSSVDEGHAGVASAFNNAVSRVGPQLAGAAIFALVTASFYNGLAERLPGVDTSSREVRTQLAPLNKPLNATAEQRQAAREESTESFSAAMWLCASLCAAGGLVNGIWIRNQPDHLADGP